MKVALCLLAVVSIAFARDCVVPNKGDGLCITTSECSSRGGEYTAGYCPSYPNSILCCTRIPCGNGGTCMDGSSCSGTTRSGLCPGDSNFKCCEGGSSGGGSWRPLNMDKVISGYQNEFGGTPNNLAAFKKLINVAQADDNIVDIRWLAYMLATAKHEVANTWLPIEEYGKGAGHSYGKPVTVTDPQGRSYTNVYYGRGYVQLTWVDNYRKFGSLLGNRLLYEPSLALDESIAYSIMSLGMRKGLFTGVGLPKYINSNTCDYYNARRIINGVDRAETIATYAKKFERILNDASSN